MLTERIPGGVRELGGLLVAVSGHGVQGRGCPGASRPRPRERPDRKAPAAPQATGPPRRRRPSRVALLLQPRHAMGTGLGVRVASRDAPISVSQESAGHTDKEAAATTARSYTRRVDDPRQMVELS